MEMKKEHYFEKVVHRIHDKLLRILVALKMKTS